MSKILKGVFHKKEILSDEQSEEYRKLTERLNQLEDEYNNKSFRLFHPIKASNLKKEIEDLKIEISKYKRFIENDSKSILGKTSKVFASLIGGLGVVCLIIVLAIGNNSIDSDRKENSSLSIEDSISTRNSGSSTSLGSNLSEELNLSDNKTHSQKDEIDSYDIESDVDTVDASAEEKLPSESDQSDSVTENSVKSFWITFLDVGQGDAALVQCDGHYMLVDGGPPSASSKIYTVLKNNRIDHIDYMIATHPDEDHIGGLSGALNYATVGKCYSPVNTFESDTFKNLLKYLKNSNVGITIPTSDTSFKLGSATVELLGPIEKYDDTNNSSIVTKINFGKNSFLLMADAETDEEKDIINANKNLDCDVIKVGHHGSKYSTDDLLLSEASPQYSIISVGKDNAYGHPTEETLKKLKSSGVTLFRTDLHGDITCTSDGNIVSFTTEKTPNPNNIWAAGVLPNTNGNNTQEYVDIPAGTTYVVNLNSKKFHLPDCSSVFDMAPHNREFSTKTCEELLIEGYSPCERCKPDANSGYETNSSASNNDDRTGENTDVTTSKSTNADTQAETGQAYVLNTNSMKFHYPNCSSVKDMSSKNRKDVVATRDEIISQGYDPCKRCKP